MEEKRIKVVVDDAIPFISGVLEPYADVVYKGGRDICREDLLDAQALIIRTRTKCDADLLEGTSVKFIATATIGTDHIDHDYCDKAGIVVRNAAGCNAGGVMNYVISALYGVASRKAIRLDGNILGIVGVGNVGKRVERVAGYLGFKVLKNDPPRAAAEGPEGFCDLDYLLANSDVVTMHVPLDSTTLVPAAKAAPASAPDLKELDIPLSTPDPTPLAKSLNLLCANCFDAFVSACL